MSWTSFALLIGVGVTAVTAGLMYGRRAVLGVIDFLLISFGLTYGPGVVYVSWVPDSALYHWFLGAPDYSVLMTLLLICLLSVGLTVLLWEKLAPGLARRARLSEIRKTADKVGVGTLGMLTGILGFILLYGALRYGLVGNLQAAGAGYSVTETLLDMPYWYTSMRQLANYLFFGAIVIGSAAIGKHSDRKPQTIVRVGLVMLLLVEAFFWGRRMLMYGLIIFALLNNRKHHFSNWRIMVYGAVILFVLVGASNVYQYYRDRVGEVSVTEAFSHLLDFGGTRENIDERRPVWAGGYLALAGNEARGPMEGALLWGSINNSIPRPLYPDKSYFALDDSFSGHYGYPRTDYPDTAAMAVIADWGILGAIPALTVLYLAGVMLLCAIMWKVLRGRPALRCLVWGGAGYVLLSVEGDFYASILTYWKYVAIIFVWAVGTELIRPRQWRSVREAGGGTSN